MLSLGKDGYRRIAADIFATAAKLKSAVRSHEELALIGDGLFNVAFRANPDFEPAIDVFHVNDSLAASGWRMNGLQLPPALHFCVTRPNTQAGVAEAFAEDLATAVEYAKSPLQPMPKSGSMYGAGGATPDPDRIASRMLDYLDATHEVGPS
jgi:sphinganine-1-phosphate aldolase